MFNGDQTSKENIEKQVLDVWDKLYDNWISRVRNISSKAVKNGMTTLGSFSWNCYFTKYIILSLFNMINTYTVFHESYFGPIFWNSNMSSAQGQQHSILELFYYTDILG